MLAVIAAMLFIGIVTAAMLKNTGSQATASGSYSNMHVMSSTVRSGMIATETFFRSGDSDKIDSLFQDAAAGKKPYIFGEKKRKIELSNNQSFSSRFDDVEKGVINPIAIFSISAGKSKNGRDVKRAIAYYKTGAEDGDFKIVSDNAPYGAKNALYSAQDLGSHIKAGIYTNGRVTVEGTVDLHRKSKFGGEVYFGDTVRIDASQGTVFQDKVYFHDRALLQSLNSYSTMFESSVGFNDYFYAATNATLNVGGDIVVNAPYDYNNITVNGIRSDSGFYYSDKLPIQTSEPKEHIVGRESTTMKGYFVFTLPDYIHIPNGCTYCPMPCNGSQDCHYTNINNENKTNELRIKKSFWNYNALAALECDLPEKHPYCCQSPIPTNLNPQYSTMPACVWECSLGSNKVTCATHPNGHMRISNKDSASINPGKGGNYTYTGSDVNKITGYKEPTGRQQLDTTVLGKLGMDSLDKRREEPMIHIDGIPPTVFMGFDTTLQKFRNDGQGFINKLNELYNDDSKLYNDHLVIKIDKHANFPDMTGLTFEKKVMFIIEDGGTLEANKFYNSGLGASTLIYANSREANIKGGFDIGKGGDFRGLICIDPDNYGEHHIKLGENNDPNKTTIHGAIHNFAYHDTTRAKNPTFNWEGKDVEIDFDETALSEFSALTCDPGIPPNRKSDEFIKCLNDKKTGNPKVSFINTTDPNKKNRITIKKALGYYFY